MPVSVLEALSRPDIALAFFIRISGIPYLFSNIPQPSLWTEALDGKTIFGVDSSDVDRYKWSQTLLIDGIGSVGQRAEPKAGIGTAQRQDFNVLLRGLEPDPENALWLGYLVRDPQRVGEFSSVLEATLDADTVGPGESITVRDATDAPLEEADYFIGLETVKAGSALNTSTTLEGIGARGAYGSWEAAHRVVSDIAPDETAGGAYVTSWPITWKGRVVDLRMCWGRFKNGEWEPYGGNAISGSVGLYSGVITAVREGDDTLTAKIQTASLDQLLARKVGARLPRARVYADSRIQYAMNHIYISDHNNSLYFEWRNIYPSAANGLRFFNGRLLDPFSGPIASLPDGLYSLDTIARSISRTINDGPAAGAITWDVQIWPGTQGQGKDARVDFEMAAPGDLTQTSAAFTLDLFAYAPDGSSRSVIADLGWKDACKFELDDSANALGGGVKWLTAQANQAPPTLIWPARNQQIPARIYFFRHTGPDFSPSPGWEDDQGNPIPGIVQIGDLEMVTITGVGTETVVTGAAAATYDYLEIGERGIFNSGIEQPKVIAFDPNSDKSPEIKQVIALPNVNFVRAFRYLFSGGSGSPGTLDPDFDEGWLNCGAALPQRLLDGDGMLAVAEAIYSDRDQIAITDETSLRDWIGQELVLSQVLLIPQSDWGDDTAYRLRLVEHGPAMEHEESTAHVLDLTNTGTLRGQKIGFDRDEGRVISSVEVAAGWDVIAGKSRLLIKSQEQQSWETWAGGTLKVEARSVGQASDDVRTAKLLMEAIYNRYSRPSAVIGLSGANALIWSWNVGDLVLITNPAIPKLNDNGRGLVAQPARIMRKKDEVIPRGATCSRLEMVANIDSDRYGAWAPSLLLTSTIDGGTTWVVADHAFSESDDPFDLTWFDGDYLVVASRRGVVGLFQRSVVSISPSTGADDGLIELDSPLALGAGGDIVLTFNRYQLTLMIEAQRRFAYWTDGDDVLERPGDDDSGFRYF